MRQLKKLTFKHQVVCYDLSVSHSYLLKIFKNLSKSFAFVWKKYSNHQAVTFTASYFWTFYVKLFLSALFAYFAFYFCNLMCETILSYSESEIWQQYIGANMTEIRNIAKARPLIRTGSIKKIYYSNYYKTIF